MHMDLPPSKKTLKPFHDGILALILISTIAGAAHAQSYNFTMLDHPLAVLGTYPQGISGNRIVGVYYTSGYVSHGFIYDGTNYTTLDVPGSELTNIKGISGNRMVGYFGDTLGTHGFLYDGTNFTTLDDTNAQFGAHGTFACGISGTNIVGYFENTNLFHGFVYNGTSFKTIDYPAAVYGTYLQGIDGTNMVGLGYDIAIGNGHSFIYNGTSFTTLSNSVGAVDAFGISGGKIVGYAFDGSTDHGFIYDGTNYTTLDYPLAPLTAIYGIDGNNLVGIYFDSGGIAHGFLARVTTPAPRLTISLGTSTVTLQWPTDATGFNLYQITNLMAVSWSLVPIVPTTSASNKSVTLPLDSTNRLFRLQNP